MNSAILYQSKQTKVSAIRYTALNHEQVIQFTNGEAKYHWEGKDESGFAPLLITTSKGWDITLNVGDYIVADPFPAAGQGNFNVLKKEMFEQQYQPFYASHMEEYADRLVRLRDKAMSEGNNGLASTLDSLHKELRWSMAMDGVQKPSIE